MKRIISERFVTYAANEKWPSTARITIKMCDAIDQALMQEAADVAVCAVQSFAYYHGGIVGYNRGTVSGCTSAVTLSLTNAAQSIYYGGIAGESDDGTLRDNLAIGASVPATADNSHGAIVGGNYDSYLCRQIIELPIVSNNETH